MVGSPHSFKTFSPESGFQKFSGQYFHYVPQHVQPSLTSLVTKAPTDTLPLCFCPDRNRNEYALSGLTGKLTKESSVMTIRKVKSGYRLVSKKGKNLGTYKSKAGAEKRERQVQFFKKKAAHG